MSPGALAAWSASALLVSLLTNNPVYRVLVALAAINLLAARARPGRARVLARFLTLVSVASAGLTVLLGHSGAHRFWSLPAWMPLVGGPLTLESLAFGAATSIGIVAAVLAVAPITAVGEVDEMVDALPRGLHATGAAMAAALNLVPALGRSFESVRDAQLMRGWRPRRLGTGRAVLLPVALTAIESSVELAEAMEARAYGSGSRVRGTRCEWSRPDLVIAASAALTAVVFLGARLGGTRVDWYPYPGLAYPPVHPGLAFACLLLLTPSVTWLRASRA